jgi:hypothetical protein
VQSAWCGPRQWPGRPAPRCSTPRSPMMITRPGSEATWPATPCCPPSRPCCTSWSGAARSSTSSSATPRRARSPCTRWPSLPSAPSCRYLRAWPVCSRPQWPISSEPERRSESAPASTVPCGCSSSSRCRSRPASLPSARPSWSSCTAGRTGGRARCCWSWPRSCPCCPCTSWPRPCSTPRARCGPCSRSAWWRRWSTSASTWR